MTQLLTSVRKALGVLDYFSADEHELSLTEISRRMGMHKGSVYRILRTLESVRLLERDSDNNRYRLGLRILELADRVVGRFDLRLTAAPFMEELARQTGEIIHLSILDGGEIVYLEKKGQGQVLTVATRVGGRNPAHASAMGKVLLAHLPAEERQRTLGTAPLASLTRNTITDRERLAQELEEIRSAGCALDNEEAFPGIRCVAAPVRERRGKVVAAISATVPAQRMDSKRIEELKLLIMGTASRISERVIDSWREGES